LSDARARDPDYGGEKISARNYFNRNPSAEFGEQKPGVGGEERHDRPRAPERHRASRVIGAMLKKLIKFYDDRMQALDALGADRHLTLQELADEAFADLLKKYRRPVGLAEALRQSADDAKPAPKRR
jgi:hypothetical protein